ncbi:MAG: hypothetical protein JWQ09_3831, partial [Segetibacter sp.]|nr:hypothetical protein [Segetibacter sp.]
YANTEGFRNTAVGAEALYSNLTGSYNSAFGTGANVGFGNLINATAIGANATVNASNTVQIGNSAATDVYFGNGTATLHANSVITPSDARFKYNIQSNVPGLDFITKLTPVTYYFDEQKLEEYTKTGYINNNIIKPASYNGQKQLHTGFLAQDVEKIANELGYTFDGVHAPANDKDHYSLAYSQFIMPLVKAVQEQQLVIEHLTRQVEQSQSAIIVKQQQIIDDKQQQIDTLKARLDKVEKLLMKQ